MNVTLSGQVTLVKSFLVTSEKGSTQKGVVIERAVSNFRTSMVSR